MSHDVFMVISGGPRGSHWVWEGTPSPVQSDDVVNLHLSRALQHTDAASSSPIARPWGRDDQTGQRTSNSPSVLSLMECSHPALPVDVVTVAKI